MISTEEKRQIIEAELKGLHKQKYRLELQGRACKAVDNKDSLDKVTEVLANVEGQIDFYESELKGIEDGGK